MSSSKPERPTIVIRKLEQAVTEVEKLLGEIQQEKFKNTVTHATKDLVDTAIKRLDNISETLKKIESISDGARAKLKIARDKLEGKLPSGSTLPAPSRLLK